MKIAEKTVVGLTYELKVSKDENDIESAPFSVETRNSEDPFYFIFGLSGLPEKFEEMLSGKSEGEDFSFELDMEEAYGAPDEELVINMSKENFTEERGFTKEMLEEGNFLPLMDDNGYPMQAKILKIQDEELVLDFNHPLVGFDLHFEGNVLEVRAATEEELAHGHVHGEHGEHD